MEGKEKKLVFVKLKQEQARWGIIRTGVFAAYGQKHQDGGWDTAMSLCNTHEKQVKHSCGHHITFFLKKPNTPAGERGPCFLWCHISQL